MSRETTALRTQRIFAPNVLVVGETGVGKSSIINLLAGELLADVSSGAHSCTFEATSYDIVLYDGQRPGHVRLFDTVGLNKPNLSKNDYLTAIEKANVLISQLQRTGGIHLLIFCIRGGRITTVTQSNYRLFRYALCQDQVPVAFVITGMESEDPMEGWWRRNASLFDKARLSCASHVCVTATRGLNGVYSDQYEESQVAIRKMLMDFMSGESWKPERIQWFSLTSMLLKWAEKIGQNHKQHLTIDELARRLEEGCSFGREEAVELASRILRQRMENTGPECVIELEVEDGDSNSSPHPAYADIIRMTGIRNFDSDSFSDIQHIHFFCN